MFVCVFGLLNCCLVLVICYCQSLLFHGVINDNESIAEGSNSLVCFISQVTTKVHDVQFFFCPRTDEQHFLRAII